MMREATAKLVGLSMILGLAACGGGAGGDAADLILHGGAIVTGENDHAVVEALAARDGRIVAVGTAAEIDRLRGPRTEVIDLAGAAAFPGFVEGHGHFTSLGRSLTTVDLRGARDWPEVVARVAAATAGVPAGRWVVGRGWHQEKWTVPPSPSVEGYPTHDRLTAAVPDHPVVLTHASGHAAIVNARALELAGIDDATPDPDGGTILRDADGHATGVLIENAEELVRAAERRAEDSQGADERRDRLREAARAADRECLSKGVTSFQDAGSDLGTVDALRRLAADGEIGVRLWVMLSDPSQVLEGRLDDYLIPDESDHHFAVGGIKRWLDGALGSHGAWLLEPYDDLSDSTGIEVTPMDEMERTARLARDHGFQLCVHAIGDRANRETLDLYERAFDDPAELRRRRWRIEHAQHLDPADIPRFGELGVIASMQTVHCTSDGPWVPQRLGERRAAEGAYAWRSLIDSGATVSNGTDTPVEDVDPIANFHAAVTRRMADGRTFHPEQAMTRLEALHAATIDAAYAAFQEDLKGTLAPGKLADVVVLSEDIMSVPEERIRDARVLYTIVGGRVLYRAETP